MDKQSQKLITNAALITAAYFLIVKPILQSFGIVKSQSLKEPDTIAPSLNVWSGKPFIDSFKGRSILLLTFDAKNKYADQIYNALPTFGIDDSSTIFGVFRGIKTKTQVADLAEFFKNKYKYDLFDFLKSGRSKDFFWSSTTSGLSSTNLKTVVDIVNAKPNYK